MSALEDGDLAILLPIRDAIFAKAGGRERLNKELPRLVQDAIDFVVDPVRTARTRIVDLDNVEKTFVGLKIEHFFRDFIDVPKGVRDLSIDGVDLDVKNTVGRTWTIPPETYRNSEPVLLFAVADTLGHCSIGLLVARPEYLSAGENRDAKKALRAEHRNKILWLFEKVPLPDSRWTGIDMSRFRKIRMIRGGSSRAAAFFTENLDRPIHRSVVQSLLYDQHDYMKRLRWNGGARNILFENGILLLSGSYHRGLAEEIGCPVPSGEEFVSHRFEGADLPRVRAAGYFTDGRQTLA